MQKISRTIRLYDGSLFCGSCGQCPAVDYDASSGNVVITDPAKPERGRFEMTAQEYNTLLGNAKLV